MEKATCRVGRPTPRAVVIGLVNSAQTYCGLEMAAMQTSPRMSWSQRVILFVVVIVSHLPVAQGMGG